MPGRKYGWKHQQVRERMRRQVEAGGVMCARCGKPIIPGTPWDAGHVDGNPNLYQGAEHRRCNRGARPGKTPQPAKPAGKYPATEWMRKSDLDGRWQPCSRQWHSDVVANPVYQSDDVGPEAA